MNGSSPCGHRPILLVKLFISPSSSGHRPPPDAIPRLFHTVFHTAELSTNSLGISWCVGIMISTQFPHSGAFNQFPGGFVVFGRCDCLLVCLFLCVFAYCLFVCVVVGLPSSPSSFRGRRPILQFRVIITAYILRPQANRCMHN